MALRVDGDAQSELQLLVFEGGNQAPGFRKDLNLGGFGKTGERPGLGALRANDARADQTVPRLGQGDVRRRAPYVATVA